MPGPSSADGNSRSSSFVTRRSDTEPRYRLDRVWRTSRGPVFALVVGAAAYLLTRTSFPIQDLAPVFLVLVVGIAAVDGSRSGVASGLIMVAYVASGRQGAEGDGADRADARRCARRSAKGSRSRGAASNAGAGDPFL